MAPKEGNARNVASSALASACSTVEGNMTIAPPAVAVASNDLVDDQNPRAATGGPAPAATTAVIEVVNKFNDLTTCAKSVDDSCAVPVLCKPIKLARVAGQLSAEDDASCDETAVNTSNEDNLDDIGVVLAAEGSGGPPVNVGVAAPLSEHQAPSSRAISDALFDTTKSHRKCEDEEFCDIARMLSGDDYDTAPEGSPSQYTSPAEAR